MLGGGKSYTSSHEQSAIKDNVVALLIPNKISECALWLGRKEGEMCMSDEFSQLVAKQLNTDTVNLEDAKQHFKCETERCVMEAMTAHVGRNAVKREIANTLKVKGPHDDTLLSNVNIDATLAQWKNMNADFYPYNFNMLNYASYNYKDGYVYNSPDSLATVLFADLYTGEFDGHKYKCAACVINSDVYQGGGKHWMALFADTRGDKWSVEFFNSSGNSPAPEWVSWMVKTKNAMELMIERYNLKNTVEMVRVTNIRHQQSRTECGLYSLFYIWSRLNGVSYEYFQNHPIRDQLMFEFRHHLFDDPKRKPITEFNWETYTEKTKVKWE